MSVAAMFLVGLGILGFGLVSERLRNSPLTLPLAFVALGCLVSQHGLGLIEFDLDQDLVHLLLELTLILVLFSDATRIELRSLVRDRSLPSRLLVIGLPLTIVAGTIAGRLLLPGVGLWTAALLAAVLAPTDAALGQAVIGNRSVPQRIRQSLNAESGLNDGLALPAVLILLALTDASQHEAATGALTWIRFVALQIVVGSAMGAAVGFVGGRVVDRAIEKGWMSDVFRRLSVLGLALFAFSAAELAGGNGFIAAFCAGLALGNSAREICSLEEFAEAEGQLLTLLVFTVFGGLMVPVVLEHLDLRTTAYAVASLTIVRMVPVSLSLLGTGVSWETHLFLGWFGPRGLASILFAILVVEEADPQVSQQLYPMVAAVVLLSIVAHGASAAPAARWYASRMQGEVEENRPVSEMPTRLPDP